ncbi:MAG: tyrosine-type recombinase/integrase [Acidimicrobiales bacterium]
MAKRRPTGSPRSSGPGDELMRGWLDTLRSANTRSAYAGDLDRFIRWCDRQGGGSPLIADAAAIERYRSAGVAAGAAGSTLARRMSALRSFYCYAVEHGALTVSPVGSWVVPADASSATDGLTPDDVRRLVAACAAAGPRTSVLVGLLLYDGIRLGEILGADVGDVAFRGRAAHLAVDRRDGVTSIRLDGRTARPLRTYLDGRTTGPLLLGASPTRAPARLTRFGADYLLKQASATAGLEPPISANALRRSFAGRLRAEGVTVGAIRDRMGHSDVRTTLRHLPDQAT